MLADQDVLFVHDQITPTQVESHQVLYINDILIQSCEQHCQDSCAVYHADWPGFSLFTECCHLSGHFSEVCDNCKWQNHAAQCSVQNRENDNDGDRDDSDNRDLVFMRQRRLPATAEEKAGDMSSNAGNLIVLWWYIQELFFVSATSAPAHT